MALSEKYVSSTAPGGGDGSQGSPFTWAEMVTDINAGGKGGTRYNVKADGTYSRTTTADTISGNGNSLNPIIIRGYKTNIGDGYLGRTNRNGALISTNMPSITYTTGRINVTGSWIILESLNVTGAPSNPTITLSSDSLARACVVTNSSTNASAIALSLFTRCFGLDNDIFCTNASGTTVGITLNVHGRAFNNRIVAQNTTASCISIIGTNGNAAAINNYTISGLYGIAITSSTANPILYGNTAVGCASDAVFYASGTLLNVLVNNMLTDCAGFGINAATGSIPLAGAYIRSRDNASGVITGNNWWEATAYLNVTGDLGGPESDYINYNAQNLNLVSTSLAVGSGIFGPASIGALQYVSTGSSIAQETTSLFVG